MVRARPVIPLLVTFQFLLEPQLLDVEFVGAALLFFGPLLFAVALLEQRAHNRFQRFAVFG